MRTYKEDYEFGKSIENEILPIISKYFSDNIKYIQFRYSTYDFKGKNTKYELKSRTNCKDAFSETLLPNSKLKYCDKQKTIFLFKFTDGLYYIEYKKELFDTFTKDVFCRHQRSDYYDKPQLYVYIPVAKLIKIQE